MENNSLMRSSTANVLLIVLLIFTFPIWIGIAGGLLGIVVGVFGAVFGVFAGIIGAVFGAIGGIFGWIFDFNGWAWSCDFWDFNIFTLAAVAILIVIIAKARKR